MSTHDDTTPVPARPDPPAGDPPTTPIPLPGTARTEEPTLVFDTFTPEPAPGSAAAAGSAAGPGRAAGAAAAGSPAPTEPVRLTKPAGATEPPVTPRTSAFAAAGAPSPAGSSAAAPAAGSTAATTTSTLTATATAPREERPSGSTVAPPAAAEPEISRSLRVGTVVWGLVLAIIGAGIIAIAAGARFDLELVAIGLLALAGVALVVGSVVTAGRRKR